jgi:hypothetical protein
MADDPLADFERRAVTLRGETKNVLVAGHGPAVIVMAEMPGSARTWLASAAGSATQDSPCSCRRCSDATARVRGPTRVGCPHSVVTAHLIDAAGEPTIAARDEILAFLVHRLVPRSESI